MKLDKEDKEGVHGKHGFVVDSGEVLECWCYCVGKGLPGRAEAFVADMAAILVERHAPGGWRYDGGGGVAVEWRQGGGAVCGRKGWMADHVSGVEVAGALAVWARGGGRGGA